MTLAIVCPNCTGDAIATNADKHISHQFFATSLESIHLSVTVYRKDSIHKWVWKKLSINNLPIKKKKTKEMPLIHWNSSKFQKKYINKFTKLQEILRV